MHKRRQYPKNKGQRDVCKQITIAKLYIESSTSKKRCADGAGVSCPQMLYPGVVASREKDLFPGEHPKTDRSSST